MTKAKFIKFIIASILAIVALFLPYESMGFDGVNSLNPLEIRVIAVFVMAAFFWILQPFPIWSTSVLVIVLMIVTLSDSALNSSRVDQVVVKSSEKAELVKDDGKKISITGNDGLEIIADSVDADRYYVRARKGKGWVEKSKITMLDGNKARVADETVVSVLKTNEDESKETPSEEVLCEVGLDEVLKVVPTSKKYKGYTFVNASCGEGWVPAPKADIHDTKTLSIVKSIDHKKIMGTFANPIIMLFLGGFFLAAAATKYKMDLNLARVLLKPFGKNPKFVLLGLMIITAVFSMFMSNTATAAMMLAILGPVLKLFDANDRGKAAFALAIPLGANIGGMGTPIGTPPNAIALGALQSNGFNITFGQWMEFGVPYVIILMVIAWLLLLKLYPIKMKEMKLNIEGANGFDKSPRAIIVYITFAVCVLLWVTGSNLHGINDNAIAMIPIAVFALTGVITKKDLNEMSWDVLWLVAGGFALGVGLNETGLASHLINTIPFSEWSPMVLMVGCGLICLFMANFMSHTSTASLLVPIFIVVAVSCKDNLAPLGGVTSLMVAVAFASSLGMCLPISTPPNALAHATGYTDTRGMAITGIVMGIGGLVLSWLMMFGLSKVNFFGEPTTTAAAPAAAVAAPADSAATATVDSTVVLSADSAAAVVVDSAAAAPAEAK